MRNGPVVYQMRISYQKVADTVCTKTSAAVTMIAHQKIAETVCIKSSAAVMMTPTIPPWVTASRVLMHQSTTAPKSSRSNLRRSHTALYTRQHQANTSALTPVAMIAPRRLAPFTAHDSMAMQSISS